MEGEWEYREYRPRPSRRGFLKAALLMGVSSAAGIGASWLVLKDDEPPIMAAVPNPVPTAVLPSPVPPPTLAPVVDSSGEVDTAELMVQLDVLKNENYRLQTELANSQAAVGTQGGELSNYQAQVADLNAQLQGALGRNNILRGLLALYTHLDTLDLDDLAELGTVELSSLLQKSLLQVPLVRDGVVAAATVLDQLELSLPTIQDGLIWLSGLVNQVANALQAMEDALAQVVEPFQPMMQKLSAFSAKILDWIPFGWGDNIEMGLNGIIGVLTHMPELVRAAGPAVLDPIGDWFDGGKSVAKIKTGLIDVVRGQTMQSSTQLAADLEQLETDVTTRVVTPMKNRLDSRRLVREQIARYRQQHGL